MYDLKSNRIRLFQKLEIWKCCLLKAKKQMKTFVKVYNKMYGYWSIDIAVNESTQLFQVTVCFYHFTCMVIMIESLPYNSLNVKKLFAQSRFNIWKLSDSKVTRTYNHLVRKSATNNLAKAEVTISGDFSRIISLIKYYFTQVWWIQYLLI